MERIEAITDGAFSDYTNAAFGVIMIYTKKGVNTIQEKREFHTVKQTFEGFYNAREFYSPNYSELKEKKWNEFADIRNTLYWNPYIYTDENGLINFSYFNSEVPTNVNIRVEGITSTGIPIVLNTQYKVEK